MIVVDGKMKFTISKMVFQIPIIMNIMHMQVDFQQNISKIRNMSSFFFFEYSPHLEKNQSWVSRFISRIGFFFNGMC